MRLFYSCCSACIAPSGASLSLAIITELWLHPLMLMRGADKISDCAHGLWMEIVCLSASLPVISYSGSRFYPTGHALTAKQLAKMLKPSVEVGRQRRWSSSDQESPQRRRTRKMSQHCSFCDAKHYIQARGRLLMLHLVIFETGQPNQPVIDPGFSSYRWMLDSPVICPCHPGWQGQNLAKDRS